VDPMGKTPFLPAILCASTLALTALTDKSDNTLENLSRATIPFELVLKHVLVSVEVNNSQPLPFILDTGDKFAVIDLDRAKELRLSLQGDIQSGGAGAAVLHGSYIQGSSFTISGFEGYSQPITIAFPLKNLEARSDTRLTA